MTNEEEKGFEFVDKRASREATEAEEPVEETSEVEAEETEAGGQEAGEEQIVGDVYSLVQWMILMLAESAWAWMGLHMNPATKKVEKDMAQAKVAVDSVTFLVDQVAPHVSEEQRKAYRQLVNDLRVNFVQQGLQG